MDPDDDSLVSLIYEGVISDDDWYEAMNTLCESVGGAMFHNLRATADGLNIVGGIASHAAPAGKLQEYAEHYVLRDVRMPLILGRPPGSVVLDHEQLSAKTIANSPIYADWLREVGLRHTLGIQLSNVDGVRDILGVMRPREDGSFAPSVRVLLERLVPHLARASILRSRMAWLELAAASGLGALDTLRQALVVVDVQGRVMHANPPAHALARQCTACRLSMGRLQFSSASAQARFLALLFQACGRGPKVAGAMRVRSMTPGATSDPGFIAVSVVPLKPSHPVLSLQQRPLALVVLAPPGASASPEHDSVRQLLGLTSTEAHLAIALALGKTVQEFAASQPCSEHTARTHLRNLMRKTGCHRQADVVRLVESLRIA